jgi:hypothetical protein
MTSKGQDDLARDSEQWVKNVSYLQSQIRSKLLSIGFLRDDEEDNLSHHLAEVAFACSVISSQSIPSFLSNEGTALGDISVDLLWDLKEMKDAIASMEEDLVKLMNHLNS